MRKIYLTVFLIFIISVFLFIISFIYLDKHNHTTLYYDTAIKGQYIGTTKIDKFLTEEKIVYKSISSMPFRELFTEKKIRIDLDKKYNFETYQKELTANKALYLIYAENKDDSVSFLSKFMSSFRYLSGMPIRKGTFIFEEDSPVTYMPIIENYDFRRGRSQGFNSLVFLPSNDIPPLKRFVTLTSIKNEYLKIGHRKIKTENLLLKIKGLPPGNVWVAKSDKSLIMIEIPSIGLKMTRNFNVKQINPKERIVTSDKYTSKNVTFDSKNRQLSGTLTSPAEAQGSLEGKTYPAALLVWGSGPQDRNYQGFFESLSDHLSKNGYCVLRFDRRGVGASGGKTITATQDDDLADITAAANFLKSQKNVNPGRIAVIAHSEGTINTLRLAAGNPDIRSIILMAPLVKTDLRDYEKMIREKAVMEKWDEEYLRSVLMSLKETDEIVHGTKHDWTHLLGKRCYLKAMRVDGIFDPKEAIVQISAPILIMHGKNDMDVPAEYGASLDKTLAEYGKMKHSAIYYSYLGHFFGKLLNDGLSKMYYDVDKEVLTNMIDWLDLNNAEPIKPAPQKEGAAKPL
ncbi:MAG: alpha/beta fold hydrolase [Candidatus Omnitrophota bacterium]